MNEPTLFDGVTFEPAQDAARLTGQLERVRNLMCDGQWRTLSEIAVRVGGSEAGVSARLRDLRKEKFGAHTVERKRVDGGLWVYRVIPA
jgi:hypothetical protein